MQCEVQNTVAVVKCETRVLFMWDMHVTLWESHVYIPVGIIRVVLFIGILLSYEYF